MKQRVIPFFYCPSCDITEDIEAIVRNSRDKISNHINYYLLLRNYYIGERIALEAEKKGVKPLLIFRIIRKLHKSLSLTFGEGCSYANLTLYYEFYNKYPNFPKHIKKNGHGLLSWSYYRLLLQVEDDKAREWYEKKTVLEAWSLYQLSSSIEKDAYNASLKEERSEEPMFAFESQKERNFMRTADFIRDPYIADFLGYRENFNNNRVNYRNSLLHFVKDTLLNSDKGYAFIQQDVQMDDLYDTYTSDFIFYNFKLKAFVLVKVVDKNLFEKDVSQLLWLVDHYEEVHRDENGEPTIGLLLAPNNNNPCQYYVDANNKDFLDNGLKKELLLSEEVWASQLLSHKDFFENRNK